MKIFLVAGLLLALIVAGLTGCAAWLGYFGGDLFVPVRSTAPAAPGRRGLAAVIVSGDMGFKVGMGPRIAEGLAKDGIPVLGVNSLVHFRNRRSLAEVEAFISDAVRRGVAFGHGRRLILIGQSFGADIVQAGLAGLPPPLRAKLALVALIVPGDTVDYQASPAELLNLVKPDASALLTARRLNWVPVLCIQGREETDSLCPHLAAPNVEKIVMPGGHPLRGDADGLYARIVMSIDRHAASRGGHA